MRSSSPHFFLAALPFLLMQRDGRHDTPAHRGLAQAPAWPAGKTWATAYSVMCCRHGWTEANDVRCRSFPPDLAT